VNEERMWHKGRRLSCISIVLYLYRHVLVQSHPRHNVFAPHTAPDQPP
jgi:hypothetical protein